MNPLPLRAIYIGHVRHRRLRPRRHEFRRRLFMLWCDADLLTDAPAAGRWLMPALRRRDFLRPQTPRLRDAVIAAAAEITGISAAGPVYVLAQPRQFAVSYNPATFYIICDNGAPAVLLVEVHNTPWGEKFRYAAPFAARRRAALDKRGHVSPFNPMEITYEWRFSHPGARFAAAMRCLRADGGADMDVVMSLARAPITRLRRAAMAHPFAAAGSLAMIYLQAFRLWLKGAPFYPHPRRR